MDNGRWADPTLRSQISVRKQSPVIERREPVRLEVAVPSDRGPETRDRVSSVGAFPPQGVGENRPRVNHQT